tara:strand:+ start:371 stop:1594 length:1224 start_codon:yes stop_codon:yes gene_type:complete
MFKTFRRHSSVETVLQILWSEPKVSRQAGCSKADCLELNTSLAMWRTVIRRVHKTNRVGWDEYIPLWQALKLQARYNSPLFSSHGINHSMCTAYFMCILMKNMPGMNIALWAALLHDVGYSEYELCQRPENCDEMKGRLTPLVGENSSNSSATGIRSDIYRKNKFLHAKLGAKMVQYLLRTSPRLFKPSDTQRIVKAISEHNADSRDSTRYDPSRDGTFMSIHDYCLERKYRLAIFEERPLLTLLRLADNLDISRSRLTVEQQSQALVLYQRWLYNHKDACDADKCDEWERLCGLFGLVGLAQMLFEKSTPEEFKFTYSCWILQWVTIEEWNIPRLVLDVELYRPSIATLTFENNFQEGMFQFHRLHSALQSIRVDGALLDVRVNMNGKQYLLDKLLEFENYEEMIK